MEIGHKNPFVMNQYGARYVSRPGAARQEDFDAALGTATEGAEKDPEKTRTASKQDIDYRKFLQEKMEEMRANIKKGTIQPKFQIGGEAYTQEEWQELLDKIDAAEEVLREQVEEEIAAAKDAVKEEEDSQTRIITRADGARILLITTPFGEMSVELSKPDDSAAYSGMIRENSAEDFEEKSDGVDLNNISENS